MKLPRRARVKIIASLAGCHHDRLGKFRTCVSTLFPKVKVAANSRCSLELFLFDTIFLPPYPFCCCATTQKQRFSTRRDILGEKYFLGWETIYIYTFDFWTIAFQFTMVERIDAVFRRRVVDRGTKNAWTRGKRAREKEREKRGEGSEGEITPYITKVEFKFLRFRPGTND